MVTENLARSFATAREVLANVKPDQYDDPTPCASWKVRDVLGHLVGGTHFFAASTNAGVSPEGGDDVDHTQGDVLASYDAGVAASLDAFGAEGAQEKIVKLPFGDLPGAVFMNIATTDVFTHAWDLAKATGQSTDLDPELAEQLLAGAQAMISGGFRGPDGSGAPFGPKQEAPEGASAADRLAAFLGRTV